MLIKNIKISIFTLSLAIFMAMPSLSVAVIKQFPVGGNYIDPTVEVEDYVYPAAGAGFGIWNWTRN